MAAHGAWSLALYECPADTVSDSRSTHSKPRPEHKRTSKVDCRASGRAPPDQRRFCAARCRLAARRHRPGSRLPKMGSRSFDVLHEGCRAWVIGPRAVREDHEAKYKAGWRAARPVWPRFFCHRGTGVPSSFFFLSLPHLRRKPRQKDKATGGSHERPFIHNRGYRPKSAIPRRGLRAWFGICSHS